MGTRAEELTRDIERVRGDLGSTLEAIGDRVAPKKVAARAKAKATDKVEDLRERVSPKRVLERRTEDLRTRVRRVQASVTGRSDDMASGDSRASRGTKAARGQARQVSQRTGRAASSVAEQAKSAPEAIKTTAQGRPVAAALVAFGAGVLIARLMPPTERERQAAARLKEKLEPVKQQAVEVGKSMAGELQQSAQESVEQVKERATKATEQVKQEAQSSAKQVKGQAKGAARQVKGQAKGAAKQVKGQAKGAARQVKGQAKRSTRTTRAAARG